MTPEIDAALFMTTW